MDSALSVSYTHLDVYKRQGQTFRDLPVRITLANIELEFIVHIVDRNIKRIGGRSKRCLLYTSVAKEQQKEL